MKTTNSHTSNRILSGVRPTGNVHLGNYLWRR
jgi:tryptophanyl-tRNA synthetase